ncbi:hypothetical protein ASZ90_004402 [hydrocarbon metagenome]|uniref:Uncharacterized protein n=1 Tax=hydrocarbon metagenome TaxID=938273 RepID=A0A0W8FY44_9ZZZZ
MSDEDELLPLGEPSNNQLRLSQNLPKKCQVFQSLNVHLMVNE